MFILAITMLVGHFLKSLSQTTPPPCTRQDVCLPVPERVCDKSLCKSINITEFNKFAMSGLNLFTWNRLQKIYADYCPFTYKLDVSKDDSTLITLLFTFKSGPGCVDTTNANVIFNREPLKDAAGEVKFMTMKLAGETFDACYVHFEPGVAVIFRGCTQSSTNGESCATFSVKELSAGDCNRSGIDHFLAGINISLPQETSNCIS